MVRFQAEPIFDQIVWNVLLERVTIPDMTITSSENLRDNFHQCLIYVLEILIVNASTYPSILRKYFRTVRKSFFELPRFRVSERETEREGEKSKKESHTPE